jgi:RNA polymerase sigma factor (TIGR02999 family)
MSDTVVDRLLADVARGDDGSKDRLIEAVYRDLHHIAKSQVAWEKNPEGTIGATALVHEAWMRLSGDLDGAMRNRAYFYGAAAQAMRRVLIDRARSRNAGKRGGGLKRLPLEGIELSRDGHDDELIELDGLIEALAQQDERLAEVVRLRFWAGLSTKETARALECSDRTVKRDWAYARAFLIDSLGLGGEDEDQPDDL